MIQEPSDDWFKEQLEKMTQEEIRDGIKSTLHWLKDTREAIQSSQRKDETNGKF